MSDHRTESPSFPGPDRVTLPGRAAGALPPLARSAPPPARLSAALRIGAQMAGARLIRRSTALSALLGAALVAAAGVIERRVGSAGAADRALAATFNLVVPLLSFALAATAAGRENLRDAVWPAARYGLARRDVALGLIAGTALGAGALSAVFAVLAVIVAAGPGNPPMAGDMVTSAWIGALAAAAYVGWFALGSTFGRRGGGRWAPLVADFVIGGSTGLAGAMLPRGNVASLLGGAPPLHLSQPSSSVILGASAVALAALAALRCRE